MTDTGQPRPARRFVTVLPDLWARSPVTATTAAPHVRSRLNADRLLLCFVYASVPAWLVGDYNLGYQLLRALAHSDGGVLLGWQGAVHEALGFAADPGSVIDCVVLGLLYHAPLFVVAVATTMLWEAWFASRRGRRVDRGWLMSAWLFALLLPPTVTPGLAVLAVSFGVVFGAHIFGGTGKYLLSPALLGVLFLQFSYPGLAQTVLPVEGFAGATSWAELARPDPASAAAVPGFAALLLGRELGAIGPVSALACFLGTAYLVVAGAGSWRMPAGALAGLFVGAGIMNLFGGDDAAWQIPWYIHLVAGNFAFGVAFLASDPSVVPLTRPGRWAYGVLIGLLTVVIRVADPAHPEGSLYAILLAGLTVPLLDYLVVRRHRLRVPAG